MEHSRGSSGKLGKKKSAIGHDNILSLTNLSGLKITPLDFKDHVCMFSLDKSADQSS